MAGEIQALFNKYQQKYPLYTKDAIVDLMVNDGVITFEVAKKIKSGVSLFLLDKDSFKLAKNNDFSMTEIMGGSFKTTKQKTKTHFNRQIEAFIQSDKQGDCWLLSDINALNQTEWGRKAIHDSIIPDIDGSGGVTIKLESSLVKKKNYHFTAEDIQNAKNSGFYAKGDDDVIAFELAVEQVTKELVNTGKGTRIDYFDEELGRKSYLTGCIIDERYRTPLRLSNLLNIETVELNFNSIVNKLKDADNIKNNILKNLSSNIENIACKCNFYNAQYDFIGTRPESDPIHSNHAYSIKKINYGKSVIVIDPYGKEIPLSWKKFTDEIANIYVSLKDTRAKDYLNKALPQNYYQIQKRNKAKAVQEEKALMKAIEEREYQDSIRHEKELQERLKQLNNDK